MAQCSATRWDGTACRGKPLADDSFCAFHAPKFTRQRARGRKQGGRRAHAARKVLSDDIPEPLLATPADVSMLLASTIHQLRTGQIEPKIASGIGYLATVLLASMEQSKANEPAASVEFHFDPPAADQEIPHDPFLQEHLKRSPGNGDYS